MLNFQQLSDEELLALATTAGSPWPTPLPSIRPDAAEREAAAEQGRLSLEQRDGLVGGEPAPELAAVLGAFKTPDVVLFHRDDYPPEVQGFTGFAVVADGAGGWLFDEIAQDGGHVIAPVVPAETEHFIVHMMELVQRPDHALGRLMRLHALSDGGRRVLTADAEGYWWVELDAQGQETAREATSEPLIDCVRSVLERLGPVVATTGSGQR